MPDVEGTSLLPKVEGKWKVEGKLVGGETKVEGGRAAAEWKWKVGRKLKGSTR